MKYTYLLGALLIIGLLALVIAPVAAQTISLTAKPDHIPTNSDTQLEFVQMEAGTTSTVTSLTVTDPLGNVFTYKFCPFNVVAGTPVYIGYGPTYAANWDPTPKPASNPTLTGVSGEYHAACVYLDGARGWAKFDASAFFYVPEFAIATSVITTLGFAGLTLARRRFKKP